MTMLERYADTLHDREIITDFIKWATGKENAEAMLDEYFGIDRAALDAEVKAADTSNAGGQRPGGSRYAEPPCSQSESGGK